MTITTTARQEQPLRYLLFLSLLLLFPRLYITSMLFPFVGVASEFVSDPITQTQDVASKAEHEAGEEGEEGAAMDPFQATTNDKDDSSHNHPSPETLTESLNDLHTFSPKSSIHSQSYIHNKMSSRYLHHPNHPHPHPSDNNPEESITWPWPHNKNKTIAPTTTPIDASCSARSSCEECNSLTCHWCTFDEHCHAKGSPYGCTIGSNCLPPKNHTLPDDNDDDDPADKSCRSHKSCTDCVLSSTLCHWCAFDDQCHAIGSWYGCVHGTDCYSNDRCQRKSPEVTPTGFVSDIGFVPIVLIVSIGICTLFCATVVFSGARALKGAYEELAEVRTASSSMVNDQAVALLGNEMIEEGQDDVRGGTQDEAVGGGDGDGDGDETEQFKYHIETEVVPNNNSNNNNNNNNTATDTESLIQENPIPPATTDQTDTQYPRTTTTTTTGPIIGSSNLLCLTKVCQAWYIVTILSTIVIGTLTLYCFPRMPQYNLCSDELAWKSIINGLTSLKMEASFELLVSIENKNHLGIVLESFGGIMNHDGGEVGSFLVPDSILPASSITDVLVTCTVTPKKWETLGLIAEYYKGTLILSMSVNGAVKITGIDYSFPVKETNIVVKVNDPSLDDRHLCACPEWKDLYPSAAPIPEFLSGGKYGNSTWTIV